MKTFRQRSHELAYRCAALVLSTAVIAISTVLVPSSATPAAPDAPEFPTPCRGKYNGVVITESEFETVYKEHLRYLATIVSPPMKMGDDPYAELTTHELDPYDPAKGYADPLPPSIKGDPILVKDSGRADLCGARIKNINMADRDLRYARFMGARLEGVDLSNTKLNGSYWTWAGMQDVLGVGAQFAFAKMKNALLYESNFKSTNFRHADLSFADTNSSNFEEASFQDSILVKSRLTDSVLKNADFTKAHLDHAIYEPRLGALPRTATFKDVSGLSSLQTVNESGAGLRELQRSLSDNGMRIESAQVRMSLAHSENIKRYPLQKWLEFIFLETPYAYGERAERLLIIGVLLVPAFAIVYFRAISNHGDTGIWIKREPVNIPVSRKIRSIRLTSKNSTPAKIALLFSLRSAFRIGWKDFNIGEWIARLQQDNYSFEARGWARSLAGFQSLISVYLLALAVISYLG